MDLNKIISLCIKKDKKAFEKLYNHYAPVFMGVCRRYACSSDEANDILQESFIKIYRNLKQLKNQNLFEIWAKRIVINTALKAIKDRRVFNLHIDVEKMDIEDEIEEKETHIEELEKMEITEIVKLMNHLPEGYKTILNLYAVEDYSHKEIAEILDIKEATSRSQYFKAKRAFQKILLEKTTNKNYEKIIV